MRGFPVCQLFCEFSDDELNGVEQEWTSNDML